jgi:hypothetical protein
MPAKPPCPWLALAHRTSPRLRPRHHLARLPAPLRHRALLPLRQTTPGLDHTPPPHPAASRTLELDRRHRQHPAPARPRPDPHPATALGTRQRHQPTPGQTRVSRTSRRAGHPSPTTTNLLTRAGAAGADGAAEAGEEPAARPAPAAAVPARAARSSARRPVAEGVGDSEAFRWKITDREASQQRPAWSSCL